MNDALETTLRSELALLDRERFAAILRHALSTYRLGYSRISASQMAAIDEIIRRAASFDQARSSLETWMSNALQKLEARRDRTGKVESWLLPPEGGGESLGAELVGRIARQSYLEAEPPRELDGWQLCGGSGSASSPSTATGPRSATRCFRPPLTRRNHHERALRPSPAAQPARLRHDAGAGLPIEAVVRQGER